MTFPTHPFVQYTSIVTFNLLLALNVSTLKFPSNNISFWLGRSSSLTICYFLLSWFDCVHQSLCVFFGSSVCKNLSCKITSQVQLAIIRQCVRQPTFNSNICLCCASFFNFCFLFLQRRECIFVHVLIHLYLLSVSVCLCVCACMCMPCSPTTGLSTCLSTSTTWDQWDLISFVNKTSTSSCS